MLEFVMLYPKRQKPEVLLPENENHTTPEVLLSKNENHTTHDAGRHGLIKAQEGPITIQGEIDKQLSREGHGKLLVVGKHDLSNAMIHLTPTQQRRVPGQSE
jgi:hypothetical protein